MRRPGGLIEELHDQGVSVVVVSGYAVPPVSADKVAAILQKPFSGSELLARYVAQWRKPGSIERSLGALPLLSQ